MKRFPQVLVNVKDVDKSKLDTAEKIAASIAAHEAALGNSGRVLVRASGTESLVRVMVEAEDLAQAEKIAADIAEIVKSELK